MKYSLHICNFLEEISSLSNSVVFLYFFALITEEGFHLFLLFSLLFPVIYFGPNYGGGNEDNCDLLQIVSYTLCYTHYSRPCSRLPPTHESTGYSWTLMDKSGSVSCGVTASFSYVLVHTSFCLCPPRVYLPSPG